MALLVNHPFMTGGISESKDFNQALLFCLPWSPCSCSCTCTCTVYPYLGREVGT